MTVNSGETTMAGKAFAPSPIPGGSSTMALRDAFSRFLRGQAESQRGSDDSGDSQSATALDNLASNVDSGEDPDLVVLVERLEGFYDPDTDEFVPTGVAVEIIEGFEGDNPTELVRALGDAAPTSDEQDGSTDAGDRAISDQGSSGGAKAESA
jgi:hypothetical protein